MCYRSGNERKDIGVTSEETMELLVPDKKLREAMEEFGSAKKQYGQDMAKKLHLRRDALNAAESLADFWPPKKKPERVHELEGKLKGTFSIDLKQPYRLLFRPIETASEDKSKDDGIAGESDDGNEEASQEKVGAVKEVVEGEAPEQKVGGSSRLPPPDAEYERWKRRRKVELLRGEDTHG
jgi:proteic killer suppression protein